MLEYQQCDAPAPPPLYINLLGRQCAFDLMRLAAATTVAASRSGHQTMATIEFRCQCDIHDRNNNSSNNNAAIRVNAVWQPQWRQQQQQQQCVVAMAQRWLLVRDNENLYPSHHFNYPIRCFGRSVVATPPPTHQAANANWWKRNDGQQFATFVTLAAVHSFTHLAPGNVFGLYI